MVPQSRLRQSHKYWQAIVEYVGMATKALELFHVWWPCPLAYSSWTNIFKEINNSLSCKLMCEPKVGPLSILPEEILQGGKHALKIYWLQPGNCYHRCGNSHLCQALVNGLSKSNLLR